MSQNSAPSKTVVISIFIALGLWLALMLVVLTWFQTRYIQDFTANEPQFLQADFTDQWFQQLLEHIPPKTSHARIIQFWQPECLCNRFARPHALKAMNLSQSMGYEHITLISERYAKDKERLQSLNPNTRIIALKESTLPYWPASPSILLEGPFNQLLYIGPLGFGAFCSQATTSVIETQLTGLQNHTSRPFYNQVGKGCFCPWNKTK